MRRKNLRKLFFPIILAVFSLPALNAEDRRTIPLDMRLIIDGSVSFKDSKNGAVAWISEQLVDRVLADGDNIAIWTAGDEARLIHSDAVSGAAAKKAIKDKLLALDAGGESADFSGALREAQAALAQAGQNGSRLPYTALIAASAEALEPALSGSGQSLFRWFRSERYERWQVLVVAPDIGGKVRQAAAAYMSSVQR